MDFTRRGVVRAVNVLVAVLEAGCLDLVLDAMCPLLVRWFLRVEAEPSPTDVN